MLVCTGVQELSRGRNITNNKIDKGLLATAMKLGILRGCVTKGEAQLILNGLLKRLMRGPLSKPRRSYVLLLVALPPISRSKGMEATDFRPVLVAMAVAIGTSVPTRMASFTAEIRAMLILSKMSKRRH